MISCSTGYLINIYYCSQEKKKKIKRWLKLNNASISFLLNTVSLRKLLDLLSCMCTFKILTTSRLNNSKYEQRLNKRSFLPLNSNLVQKTSKTLTVSCTLIIYPHDHSVNLFFQTFLTRSLNVVMCNGLPVIDKVLLQGQRRGKLKKKKKN